MLVAQDFRNRARASLNGKWPVAIGTGFVASLLGAGTTFMQSSSGNSSSSSDTESYETLFSNMSEEAIIAFLVAMLAVIGIALLWGLVKFIIGGPLSLGYVKFNLGLVDGEDVRFADLFSQFHRFGEGFLVRFWRWLYVVLWTMAFFVPTIILAIAAGVGMTLSGSSGDMVGIVVVLIIFVGIIPGSIFASVKDYGYSMSNFIMYENPGMGAREAIKESQELMKGNKWRLFCLAISFIGWAFLCVFTCGIGYLWLSPYQEASFAAFYREIKRERYGDPVVMTDSYVNPYEEGNVWGNNNYT